MPASTYPVLDFFWTMLVFFGLIVWFWLLVAVLIDVVRSPDLGGFAKALWAVLVIVIPLVGVLVYLIARGSKMGRHALDAVERKQQTLDTVVRTAAGPADPAGQARTADELATLADLRAKGLITDSEFETRKQELLS